MKIDNEYSTQNKKEMYYLVDNGLRYCFVKTANGITTWKFKKNVMLFELLKRYYNNIK